MRFKRIAIIGLGLLGGSIGLAVRANLPGAVTTGYDSDPATRQRAAERGLADKVCDSAAEAVREADLVIFCVPPGAMAEAAGAIAGALPPGALVSDVGSSKVAVAKALGEALPGHAVIPAHPVAGTEHSGPDAGFAALFHNRWCIITPPADANPQLLTSAEEARSAWEGAVKDFHATESELKTNLLNQEITLNQAQFNLESAQLQLEAETELMTQNMVAGVVYKRTQLNVSQLRKTRDFEENRVSAIRTNIKVQLAVKEARVAELARTLERAKTAAANLRIVAGIDGIVQNLSADIGQELSPGKSFGRIAQPDPLYAELRVAAREASEVQVGQAVVVDTHNGKVEGTVSRVDPAITEGTVIVDVNLTGKLPAGARPQLAVEGEIFLARVADTLYVGKPSYVKANADVSIYKLDASGQYADRVVIKSGRLSLTQMQVLQGLGVGDRIITSQAGDWQDKSRIRID